MCPQVHGIHLSPWSYIEQAFPHGRWKPGTGDWWKSPPRNYKQYKKFYNDKSTERSVIIDEYDSLKIEGSVPRAVKGNNFDSITEDEFPLLEDYIRSLCKGRRVKVDLSTLAVRRVDLARNKELDMIFALLPHSLPVILSSK